MFRLPTHLESLVPPPRDQVPQSTPWRGSLLLLVPPGQARREIHVTAAETDGDNQIELWPRQLQLQVVQRAGILREVHEWLRTLRQPFPRCMFMPDRLLDQGASQANHAAFVAFSRQLLADGAIAIAPWNTFRSSPHAGIILCPSSTSPGLIVGIVLLNADFPEFILGGPSRAYMPSRLPASAPLVHHLSF